MSTFFNFTALLDRALRTRRGKCWEQFLYFVEDTTAQDAVFPDVLLKRATETEDLSGRDMLYILDAFNVMGGRGWLPDSIHAEVLVFVGKVKGKSPGVDAAIEVLEDKIKPAGSPYIEDTGLTYGPGSSFPERACTKEELDLLTSRLFSKKPPAGVVPEPAIIVNYGFKAGDEILVGGSAPVLVIDEP